MHCILNYPTSNFDANLGMINDIKKNFPNYVIGYSDHTLPDKYMNNLNVAFSLGAKVLEKHFTLNKRLKGNDHYHSMDFEDLKKLRANINQTINLIGSGNQKKTAIKVENKSRKNARRCIAAKMNLKKGSILKEQNLIALRPNQGISVEKWDSVIGKRLKRHIKALTAIKSSDLKN